MIYILWRIQGMQYYLDGASHNISVREYKHINQLNTPVYFILNIKMKFYLILHA
jgi:hypothetical protein